METENTKNTQEAVKAALSSPGNHACRSNPENMCPVNSAIYDGMLSVDNKKSLSCPNYTPFGYGGFCTSPVRKEIYQKYGI